MGIKPDSQLTFLKPALLEINDIERLVYDMNGQIFSIMVGPNEIGYSPLGWITCEQTTDKLAYGLRIFAHFSDKACHDDIRDLGNRCLKQTVVVEAVLDLLSNLSGVL